MRRNSAVADRMRWGVLALALTIAVTVLAVSSGAQAVVVNVNALGLSSTGYNPSSQTGYYGVAVVAGMPGGAAVTPDQKTGQLATAAGKSPTVLQMRMQLLPQSLRGVLRSGIAVQVSANQPATGIVDVSITRQAARRVHIHAGRGPAAAIGRGTISTIKNGTVVLHFKLSRSTVSKLKALRHVALTLKLQVIGAARDHVVIAAAGRY